jgi:hypothetical protein
LDTLASPERRTTARRFWCMRHGRRRRNADNRTEGVRSGRQGTDRPWERPGQASQDHKIKVPTRKDREREHRHNETA